MAVLSITASLSSLFWPFRTDSTVQASCRFPVYKQRDWGRAHLPKTLVLFFIYSPVAGSLPLWIGNHLGSLERWLVFGHWLCGQVVRILNGAFFPRLLIPCSIWTLQNPKRKESKECWSGWGPLSWPSWDSQQSARHWWQSWLLDQLERAVEFQAAGFQRSLLTPLKTKDCYHTSKPTDRDNWEIFLMGHVASRCCRGLPKWAVFLPQVAWICSVSLDCV